MMRSRTNPAITEAPAAARSTTSLVRILPARALRLFDAPAILTTGWEMAILQALGWLFIVSWLLTPATTAVAAIAAR
jgi:hypothetical protein